MQTSASQGTEVGTSSVLAQIERAYRLTQQLETRSLPEVSTIQQMLLKAGQEMHTLHTNLTNALSLMATIEGDMAKGESGSSLDKRINLLTSGTTSVSKQELARLHLELAQEIIAASELIPVWTH